MKELLKTVLLDQQAIRWLDHYIARPFPESFLSSPEIIVMSGIRRCGKSTRIPRFQ